MADTNPWVLDLSTNPPDIYNETLNEHNRNAFQPPYPSAFWYVNQGGNDVIHDGELSYHTPAIQSPYPYVFWFVNSDEDDVTHNLTKDYEPLGACNRCTNLATIIIPESVKKIGPNVATNTSLTSVTIASDCDYANTSFPQNCTINFYPT